MERKKQALLLALPASLALLLFFIFPMIYILIRTLAENGTADFTAFFTDPFYLDILWTTLRVSLISTAISLLLGYPTAYYMARTPSRLKQAMVIVILFPSWSAPWCAPTDGWSFSAPTACSTSS